MHMKRIVGIVLVGLGIASVLAAGSLSITGAGATFPYPMYSKWFDVYHKENPTVEINYQSIGSGGGIKQITEGTVDFGATDGPMNDDQLKTFQDKHGCAVLHFPTVLGAVVPTYNLPGVTASSNFTPQALAGIYLGKATAVKWPVGLGGQGNEGVTGTVKNTPDSIGYVELIYAESNKIPYGNVGNAAGVFVKASLAGVTAAAAGAAKAMPDDFRVSITNAPGKEAYPISSFTWLLIPARISDAAKRDALKNFL